MAGQPPEHRFGTQRRRLTAVLRYVLLISAVASGPITSQADSTDISIPDTLDTAGDSLPARFRIDEEGPAPIPETKDRSQWVRDSIAFVALLADTVAIDTTEVHGPVRLSVAVYDSLLRTRRDFDRLTCWPIPQPVHLAVIDAGGWLAMHPGYDVDDALGTGQARRYSRWGLNARDDHWTVNGRPAGSRRLSFPQDVSFDAAVIPPYDYDSILATTSGVQIERKDQWPAQAHSSYVLRQGDYGETYSQGRFNRVLPAGYGIDMGFAFYESGGPFLTDSRDTRHLRLQVAGPLLGATGWNARFEQTRDKTSIVPAALYGFMRPTRDDLNYTAEAAFHHTPDSAAHWAAGLTRESAKHDIRDPGSGYRLETHEHRWRAWGERTLLDWDITASAVLDELDLVGSSDTRWGAWIEGRRMVNGPAGGRSSLHWRLSDWDTDLPAPEFDATIHLADTSRSLIPGVMISRTRIVPTLFERHGIERIAALSQSTSPFVRRYVERGDPGLPAEWRNELTVFLSRPAMDSTQRAQLILEGHLAYVENYTTWENVGTALDTVIYQPVTTEARAAGIGIGLHTPLFWKFECWTGYAFKYAESLDHDRLTGYNPHKATWILSWIAPQIRYGIDLRLNSTLIWWYGDKRIEPTPYTSSPHVLRWDLAASAQMRSFVFHFSMQNVTNFPYRTREGEEYAVRALRFGFDWRFLD